MNQVIRLTTHDPQTTLTLFEVFHMLKPAGVLFQPRILLQVLKQALGVQLRSKQVRKLLTPV